MTSKADSPRSEPTGPVALLEAMRPQHWVKNAFVVAPILFSGQFIHAMAWARCLAATAAYCALSSAVYLLNDALDAEADRQHPLKRGRPVASGRLARSAALAAAAVLAALAAGVALIVLGASFCTQEAGRASGLFIWMGAYAGTNLLYSLRLKRYAVLDVILIAMGFVFRAMGGAAAIGVPISPWLVICTFTLCLFIGLTKRRSELLALPSEQAEAARSANRGYDLDGLEHMITAAIALAVLTYSLYCLAPQTVERIRSAHMIWTIPLVVYGMFRFNRLTRRRGAGDPVAVLVGDKVMWLVVLAYVLVVAGVLRFGPHVAFVLDVGDPSPWAGAGSA